MNKSNIVRTLYLRQISFVRTPYRVNVSIIRKLIESSESTFRQVWQTQSKQPIQCDDGKLYLNNYSTCLTLRGKNGAPSVLYQLPPPTSDRRVVDAVIFSGPVHDLTCKPECYKPFFLALSADNWLRSYDNFTGEVLQEVYIGSTSHCKYQHCDWETYGRQIVLTSTLNVVRENHQVRNKPRCLATLAVLSVLPLQFEALFRIDRAVFGADCNHVNVSDGMMIIGTGSTASGSVRLYDFAQVIESGMLFRAKLNEPCALLNGLNVGTYPAGLPMNCKFSAIPPAVFVVKCSDHIVHFGGFPWHYITTPHRFEGVFQVRNLASDATATNGYLNFPNSYYEPDRVSFHHDNSGRIVYKSAHSVRFFNLSAEADHNVTVKESYNFSFSGSMSRSGAVDESAERTKRARRSVRNNSFVALFVKSVLSEDFEEDLNLYGLLGFDPEDLHSNGKIILFDNWTGDTIKTIEIEMRLDDLDDFTLTLDMDTLVVVIKNEKRIFSCQVFRLAWTESQNCALKKQKNKKKVKL